MAAAGCAWLCAPAQAYDLSWPARQQSSAAGAVRFELWPKSATVSIASSAMAPARVSDGQKIRWPIGPAQLEISAPGFQIARRTINVTSSGTIVEHRLDPVGQLLRFRFAAQTGSNPKQVAFTPDGSQLWVPLLGAKGVDVFDAESGERRTTIRVGDGRGAVEVIFNQAGTRAFVSQMETASVFEVDVKTFAVLRRMPTGGNWTKVMVLSPDERTLFAANWVSNDVSEIDLATGRVRRRIPTVRTPRGLALDPKGERLFVAGFDGGEIERITIATSQRSTLLRTGGAMRHLVIDAASSRLYADDMGRDAVFVVDLATEAVTRLGSVDSHPNTIDLSGSGRYLFVSNRGANNPAGYNRPGPEWGSVVVMDTADGRAVDALVSGNQTTGLDVSPNGTRLAITDFLDNRLSVYDIPGDESIAAGAGGFAPNHRVWLLKSRNMPAGVSRR